MVTPAFLIASWVARISAEVDFPAPPFGFAKTIVGMEPLNESASMVSDVCRIVNRHTVSVV